MSDVGQIARMLELLPQNARRVVEAGGSDALARAYKRRYPSSWYQRVSSDADGAFADQLLVQDLDAADEAFFAGFSMSDAWVFDQTLERLADPARVLGALARILPPDACVLACIANPGHWARPGGPGIAREAMLAMFAGAGLRIGTGMALNGPAPDPASAAPPEALASHYLIKAFPS